MQSWCVFVFGAEVEEAVVELLQVVVALLSVAEVAAVVEQEVAHTSKPLV
jgi:hypothetical protein